MQKCGFDENTKTYLDRYNSILCEMIRGMTSADIGCSISQNFIVRMIPHHMAAIEMSENILEYTKIDRLRDIAENIISEQTKSIENMRSAESVCSKLKNTQPNVCRYEKRTVQIMHVMFDDMRGAHTTNNISADFIHEMIPHHRGAIEMSRNALCYDICTELEPIIYDIITSQERGILMMQRLLKTI